MAPSIVKMACLVILSAALSSGQQDAPVSPPVAPPATTTDRPTTTRTTAKATTTAGPNAGAGETTTAVPVEPPSLPRFETGKWWVTEPGRSDPCLMAEFGLILIVPYMTTGGMIFNGTVAVPPKAVSNGTCDTLVLSWPSSSSATLVNFLTMTFDQVPYQPWNDTTGANATAANTTVLRAGGYPYLRDGSQNATFFQPSRISAMLAVDPERFPGAEATQGPFEITVERPMYMSAPVNNSFRCDTEWLVAANTTSPSVTFQGRNATGFFDFKDVQVQPFMPPTPGNRFSTPVSCAADRTGGRASKIVPIAVGCALGALVIIVIFAYIVGRRRSRQRGYGSV